MLREPDNVENFVGSLLLRRSHAGDQGFKERLPAGESQLEVFKNRQLLKDRRLSKFSTDAGLGDIGFGELEQVQVPPKPRCSRIRTGLAGDDVHHRCLTGAIRPDDAAQLSGLDVKREIVERLKAVEADCQLLQIKNLVANV